jgi:hypothetical protein
MLFAAGFEDGPGLAIGTGTKGQIDYFWARCQFVLGTEWARNGHGANFNSGGEYKRSCPLRSNQITEFGIEYYLSAQLGHAKNDLKIHNILFGNHLARLTRFERATPAFGGQCSIQLSYRRFGQD